MLVTVGTSTMVAQVEVIDLGFGVLTVPKGAGHRLLDDLVSSSDDHDAFVRSLTDDPDLATT